MNKKCAFTICAKNYIGLALTLEKSLRENNPDTDFLIFVADEFDSMSPPEGLPENILLAKDACDIHEADWQDMAFKYSLVELCTSIKPFCMRYVLAKGYEFVMYFDPDILVFASLTPVFEALRDHVVVVTPHRLDIENDNPCRGGIYNLGFIGVRQGASTDRMLLWWGDRLRNWSNADPMRGFYTDQKWMDQLPVVLGNNELFVMRDPGLNYATWNFDERQAVKRDGQYFVRFKKPANGGEFPLVFLHYSAFKYKEIRDGNYHKNGDLMKNREPELYELVKIYGEKLAENNFLKYLDLGYTYDKFTDGTPIQYSHRHIYKRLCKEGYVFADPFEATGTLFDLFRRGRMLTQTATNPDLVSVNDVADYHRKVWLIDKLASLLIRVMGYPRFVLFSRFMIRYLHLNNRARLLGPEFRKLDIETF